MDGRVLHDAEALADLRADVRAKLDLFGFGDVHVVELLLALLRLLGLSHDAAELRVRRRGDGKNRDDAIVSFMPVSVASCS